VRRPLALEVVMSRRWWLFAPCVVLLAFGCARSPAPVPGLQPGDVVRPEISVAPKRLYPGDRLVVGVLLRGERPAGEMYYVNDDEVVLDRAVMSARITFLNGDQVVGVLLDVPLVHDC
jgi:hypothetical protein